jgi:hypothetical protein
MSLSLKANDLGPDDYSVIYRDPDGRALSVGRIFLYPSHGTEALPPWFWTVEFHQREGRPAPHQGRSETLSAAMAAFRACWDSADVPVRWTPALPR